MGGAFSAVVGMASSISQSRAADKAADEQADALTASRQSIENAARQARNDVLNTLEPAMQEYGAQIANARDLYVRGDTDVISILQQSTNAADQLLAQSGADVQKLILGSAATQRGIPQATFDQQYAASQGTIGQTATGTAATQGMPLTATPTTREYTGGALAQESSLPVQGVQSVLPVVDQLSGQVQPAGTSQTMDPTLFQGVPLSSVYDPATGQQMITAPEKAPVSGVAGTGYYQARSDLESARDISRSDILSGESSALAQLARGEGILTDAEARALERTATYSDMGNQAAQQEAALSGALGPEAQQAAIDSFIESPGQKYLREQQEKALLRSSAATGGLAGGRVLTALQEQAMGIAATQQQQQIENLGTIAARGATTAQGEQSLIGQMGAGRAGFAGQAAAVETQTAQDLANIESLYGPQVAQMAYQTGLQLADVQQMTDQQRAQLVSALGTSVAGVRAGTIGDIANLSQTYGTTGINQANTLATLLANIGTRAGSETATYQALQGSAQASGTLASSQALGSGIAALGSGLANAYSQYQANQTPTTTFSSNSNANAAW